MADDSPLDREGPVEAPARFGRLINSPSVRRIAVSKVGRAVAVAVLLVAILIVAGARITNQATRWLWKQPLYLVTVDDIQFDPAPPPWIIGGRERMLASLRPLFKEPVSTNEVSLQTIGVEVGKNPWVYLVDRVWRSYPNLIAVKLQYRKPVTRVEGTSVRYLDRYGVVLPRDLDPKSAGPIIRMPLEQTPDNIQEGLRWPTQGDGPEGATDAKSLLQSRVIVLAELAGFLLEKNATEPDVLPPIDQILLYPESGLWIELGPNNFLLWGKGPGLSSPSEPPVEAKWAYLKDRIKRDGPLKAPKEHFYQFTKEGIELKASPKKSG